MLGSVEFIVFVCLGWSQVVENSFLVKQYKKKRFLCQRNESGKVVCIGLDGIESAAPPPSRHLFLESPETLLTKDAAQPYLSA